jgi:hypothetical protein
MRLIAFLAGRLIASPLCAVEKDGLVLTLTEEENRNCEDDGPCLVIPMGVLERAVGEMRMEAFTAGRATCANRT